MGDSLHPTNLFAAFAKMPVGKQRCVNDPDYMYSGKEQSPLGLGIAPHKFPVGIIEKGRDGASWMVAKKNDVNVWVRVQVDLTKDKPVIPIDAHEEEPSVPTEDAPPPPAKKTKAKPKVKAVPEAEAEAEPEPSVPTEDAPPPPAKKTKAKPKAKAVPEAEKDPAPKKKAPSKKKADANDDEPKKKAPTDYNLFLKEQNRLAKEDPILSTLSGREKLTAISQHAAKLWKAMNAAEKAQAVAHMK